MIYKNHKTFASKTWIPFKVIRKAIAENWLDSLIYFIWVRDLHHRPIIYNYSARKVAARLKRSPTTLCKHIAILSEKGLCELIGANLHLKSTNSLRKEYGLLVAVGISDKKDKQRTYLRYTILKNNIHHQVKKHQQKSNALKFLTQEIKDAEDFKNHKRAAKKYPDIAQLESSLTDVTTKSNQAIGAIFNRSKATGQNIQRSMNKMRLIKSTPRIEQVSEHRINRAIFFAQGFDASYFISGEGFVYKRHPNEINLIGVVKERRLVCSRKVDTP